LGKIKNLKLYHNKTSTFVGNSIW